MPWYAQSAAPQDTHRGTLARGAVDAVCGVRFKPAGRRVPGRPDPARACPQCRASEAVR